jgi:3-oxoacyl-[acyl-carrier-protein] synthase-1
MAPLEIAACSLVSAAGSGLQAWAQALQGNRSALVENRFTRVPLGTWIGRVQALDPGPGAAASWPPDGPGTGSLAGPAWDSRATRLAWQGLLADDFLAAARAACRRHGAQRVALALGTSASTIGASELAYRTLDADGAFPAPLRHARLNTLHAVTDFVQQAIGLQGPSLTVSTACSSSAKVFAVAQRWLALGLADAVVVGGVDALCESVLFGFQALQLVSATACQPFGAAGTTADTATGTAHKGISVGEAAGFMLLQRTGTDPGLPAGGVQLLGHGEANDAHHMSSPHPQGLGAELALQAALQRAGVAAHAVQYLQLHGTGTALNDAVEAALVARNYSHAVHASATKGSLGHTMGAAGMVGALACVLALRDGLCAGTPGTAQVDATLPDRFCGQLQRAPQQRAVDLAASHAFGFGGNNCVLIFGRAALDPASVAAPARLA